MRKGFSDINWKIEEMVTPDYFEMQYGNPKTIEKIEKNFYVGLINMEINV